MEKLNTDSLNYLNQKINELVSLYRGVASPHGVSENEFWIWYALIVMGGEYSQQDICGVWTLSKQTVNSIVSNMVKKEYARLEVVPGTRNKKIIRLTDAGRAFGESVVMPIFEAEKRAVDRLSDEEKLACITAFNKYIVFFSEELSSNG